MICMYCGKRIKNGTAKCAFCARKIDEDCVNYQPPELPVIEHDAKNEIKERSELVVKNSMIETKSVMTETKETTSDVVEMTLLSGVTETDNSKAVFFEDDMINGDGRFEEGEASNPATVKNLKETKSYPYPTYGKQVSPLMKLIEKLLSAVSAFLIFVGVCSIASAAANKAVLDARDSVVRVLVFEENERTGYIDDWYGSGIVVGDENNKYILTNRHVLEFTSGITSHVFILTGGMPTEIAVSSTNIIYSRDKDLALIRAPGAMGSKRIAVLGNTAEADVTQTIYAIGFPGIVDIPEARIYGNESAEALIRKIYPSGVENMTVTEGAITKKSLIEGSTKYIQHSAITSGGNSGGPLVDEKGRVIGVNTSIIFNTASEGTAQHSIAIDIDEVKSFLRMNGVQWKERSDLPAWIIWMGGLAVIVIVIYMMVKIKEQEREAEKRSLEEESRRRIEEERKRLEEEIRRNEETRRWSEEKRLREEQENRQKEENRRREEMSFNALNDFDSKGRVLKDERGEHSNLFTTTNSFNRSDREDVIEKGFESVTEFDEATIATHKNDESTKE